MGWDGWVTGPCDCETLRPPLGSLVTPEGPAPSGRSGETESPLRRKTVLSQKKKNGRLPDLFSLRHARSDIINPLSNQVKPLRRERCGSRANTRSNWLICISRRGLFSPTRLSLPSAACRPALLTRYIRCRERWVGIHM